MVWRGPLLQCNLNKDMKKKTARDPAHLWSHIMLLWRKGVHLQDRQFIKQIWKLKKELSVLQRSTLLSHLSLLDQAAMGLSRARGPLEERSRVWVLRQFIILATLFTIQQSFSSVRHGKKVTDWMTWHMANRSIICTHFCSLQSKDPLAQYFILGIKWPVQLLLWAPSVMDHVAAFRQPDGTTRPTVSSVFRMECQAHIPGFHRSGTGCTKEEQRGTNNALVCVRVMGV